MHVHPTWEKLGSWELGYDINMCGSEKIPFNFQAIERKLTYPKYAWIMYDWYPKQWWTKLDNSSKCSSDDIVRFLDKVMTLRRYPETDDISATTEAGIVSELHE